VASAGTYRWLSEPRWYLWEGGFLLIASATGEVPPHSHHAIQSVIALEGEVKISGARHDWRTGAGHIVKPNVEHAFDCNGATGAMLFVDPESIEGAWLSGSLKDDITIVPASRLAASAAELRKFVDTPFESLDVGALIHHCIRSLSPRPAPARTIDERVTKVIAAIRQSDDLRVSLDDAADRACLSPSRFAHLFKQQLGLPFSRYMMWRKLTRAMVAIASSRTIAEAAHAADFADAAHLTRTFHQMFGMAPSVLMQGEFSEISSPFQPVPAK
jgi:AraC-like DNA-binding protein